MRFHLPTIRAMRHSKPQYILVCVRLPDLPERVDGRLDLRQDLHRPLLGSPLRR